MKAYAIFLSMNVGSDCIAAIATPKGMGAISVVRLSGPQAHQVALKLCKGLKEVPPFRRLTLVWLVHPRTGVRLDHAMVAFYEEGASYTGEEAVEFFCHGGSVVPEQVLMACLEAGARPARPGEFTQRALLSGRMDLAQAEAVAMLSEAKTYTGVLLALKALAGEESSEVKALEECLLDALSECEAYLDFAEEDGVEVSLEEVTKAIDEATQKLEDWILESKAARPAILGVEIALVGPPNAGKSSLFNALLGRSRAIVHDEPGTTRDVITEHLYLAGIPCVLADTAGLREAEGVVEGEGVRRSKDIALEADILVLVVDGSKEDPLGEVKGYLPREPDLVVINKVDLLQGKAPDLSLPFPSLCTSALKGEGVAELARILGEKARRRMEDVQTDKAVLLGERQLEAASGARQMLKEARLIIDRGGPVEVASAFLRKAVDYLFEITGAKVTEEVLDRIFSRFCVGK